MYLHKSIEHTKCIPTSHISVTDSILFLAPKPGETLSLTETLFPGVSSSLPQNRILNMTFDCNTNQLDLHIEISEGAEFIPEVLSFSNLVLSLRVTIDTPPTFNSIVLSANTQLFSIATFVAVKYDFATEKIAIKGTPTDTNSLSVENALQAVSGTSLPVPSGLSALSEVTFNGREENGVTTIAIEGKSNDNTVAVVFQKSSSSSSAALIADIRNFNLASFVNTALNVDITDIPIFGTLTIPELGFAAATGEITSDLLPMLYTPGSRLETFGTTLPGGVSAYFTVDVVGVSVNAAFSLNKLTFNVPSTSSLSVKQLLDQIPNLSVLNSLPEVVAEVLNTQVSGFNFDPQTKQLDLGFTLPELTVIPNMLKLTNVNFMLSATFGENPSIQNLNFSGTWTFSTISLTTSVEYDGENEVIKVKGIPESSGASLSIDTLLKNVAGISVDLSSALTSLSLSSMVGNIYNNGNYFIAMSGSVSGGNLYLIFYKGTEGVKVGIAASLESFQFSELVQSTVGVDITGVPYFGDLVIPAMALAITSGEIKSPALPHLFGEELLLLAYGDTLPAGVTSQFELDVGAVKGAFAEFYNGMLAFQLPKPVDFSLQNLASEIPGISDALQALPPQITSILSAKISSFAFNSTSKDLTIMASLNTLTLVSGFLSISDISLFYDGRLDKILTTRTLDFTGTWQIGDYAILTSVLYDGASKELTIESQSNGGKDLSISNVVQSLAGTTVQLPAAISSFTFTGITGKLADDITVVILNGMIGNGKISAVFQKTSSESDGAVVVDIANFQLVELVESATGIDISGIPFFGTLEIPELKFAAATDNITTPLLEELAGSGTALEWFKTGIVKGISGRFVIQIGDTSKIAANFAGDELDFKVPDTSSLSLNNVVSVVPEITDILNSLPSQLSSVFDAQITTFSYDPVSTELQFSGSLDSTVDIVPGFVSLSNVQISLILVLGEDKYVETLDFSGDWNLKDLPIRTTISYNRAENRLDIVGELDEANSGVSVPELITSLSGESLSIPSVLSSVKLSKLSGNKIDDVTLVTLSGSVSEGHIFLIYQKSPSGSAVAFAADTPKFRLSSLVSSATGIDISSVPFFGTLIIPQIGFTVSSAHISNPLLLDLYPPTSPLAEFGSSIDKGITASFNVSVADVEGIVADFAKGELDLEVPDSVDLSLIGILELIPGLQGMIDSLPQTIQDIGSTKLHKLYFVPTTSELQLRGSLDSLAIVPDFLSLQNIDFEFAGTIGRDTAVEFVKFKGDWILNSLGLTTEVFYEKNVFLISGAPTEDKSLNINDFIMGLTGTELNVPSALDALKFTGVIGKIQDGTLSIVLMGEISTKAKVSIVYEKSQNDKIVAFAADIQEFQLSELVQAATGIDITDIPFFGTLTIPAISFVISTKNFTTTNLPDLSAPGVDVPKELLLESIPAGVKGQFIADIGSALGVNADFVDNILTIEVPSSVSFSLQSLLEVIPDIKSTIDSLPSTVQDILSAKIMKLVFKPTTKDLFVSLQLDSLTLVPDILSIQELQISLDVSLATSQSQEARLQMVQPAPYRYTSGFSYVNAKLQAVSINTLDISGTWVLGGNEIETTVMYDKQLQLFNIVGIANGGSGVSIADIIQAFSSSSLPVPSVLSSLNLNKVVATSSNEVTTVVLTATAGSANVYVLYQKTPSASAIAIAAEIHAFKIVDLIETATGIDLSGTPFISSFVVSTMAFTAATNPITTPILAETFDPDGPLQVYGDTLPKGVTAEFEVQIGGKTGIAVTYRDEQLKFVVPTKVSLSLSNMLSEIPDLSSVVRDLPSPISDLLSTSIQALDFDATTKTLSVAASLDQLIIIPQIMEVKDLEVEFVAILSSNNGGLQSLDFSADWVLGDATIRINVTYDKDSGQVFFAAMPKEGLSIQQLVSGLTGVDIPLPSAINSVQLTKIVGRKTPSMFTMIFSGTIANRADVHLVYQNMVSSSHIAIAAGIESFTFSELIDSAVNIDISNVPFFGTFSVPSLALSVARGQITTDLLADVIPGNSPLIKYGNTIPDGFTAKFDAPIGNINGIIGSYSDSVLSFTVPPNVDASLGSLISVIPGIDVNSIGIGSLFKDILSIQMRSFTFDAPKKEMDIEMYLEKITFFEDILAIKDARLKLSASFSNSISVDAEASGIIALGDMDYNVSIGRDAATNKYAVTVETDNLPIFGLVTAIGAAFLPDDLQLFLKSALQFNVRDAKVVYPFGVEPQQIQLSGTPEIFGQKTVHMTAVAIRYGGKMRLISKYDFGSFNIADLIKKLVGVSLHSLKILDQTVNINFVLSPQSIKGVSLSIPEFEGYSLDQGISIRAPLDWPSDCSSDAFCNVAYNLLGGVKLGLEGTIANARSFSLTATIGDLKLGGGVVLLHAGLKFVAGTNPSVGVVGSIELSDPEITLTAEIKATVSGVKLVGSMSGCWYNAFGSSYLTLCNLYLAMTIIPSPVPISGLEFGGRVELGKQSCGHNVSAEAYVGINIINPNENYFYADVGPVTFQSVFDAFCLDVDLPKPLGDSGFPNGFKTSFSVFGVELPHAKISIPPGFRFIGTLNFLGLEAYADIYIQLPTKIKVKINLPPITLANVFKMYRSSSDKSAGPYVDAEITTKQAPHIEASGFVSVFGISIEARLLISNSKFELELTGKFLKLFEAHLFISASYSKSITSGSFLVEGWFKNDLFDTIAKAIRNALSKSADEADKHIKSAENAIRAEQAKFDRVNADLEDAKRGVDSAQKDFDVAVDGVNDARRDVDGICSYKKCGSGIVHHLIFEYCPKS